MAYLALRSLGEGWAPATRMLELGCFIGLLSPPACPANPSAKAESQPIAERVPRMGGGKSEGAKSRKRGTKEEATWRRMGSRNKNVRFRKYCFCHLTSLPALLTFSSLSLQPRQAGLSKPLSELGRNPQTRGFNSLIPSDPHPRPS